MKTTATLTGTVAMLLLAAPAFAVNTAKVYKSGPLVLIFLGFFALLIIMQMIPAITTLFAMVKGLMSEKTKPAEAVAETEIK